MDGLYKLRTRIHGWGDDSGQLLISCLQPASGAFYSQRLACYQVYMLWLIHLYKFCMEYEHYNVKLSAHQVCQSIHAVIVKKKCTRHTVEVWL